MDIIGVILRSLGTPIGLVEANENGSAKQCSFWEMRPIALNFGKNNIVEIVFAHFAQACRLGSVQAAFRSQNKVASQKTANFKTSIDHTV